METGDSVGVAQLDVENAIEQTDGGKMGENENRQEEIQPELSTRDITGTEQKEVDDAIEQTGTEQVEIVHNAIEQTGEDEQVQQELQELFVEDPITETETEAATIDETTYDRPKRKLQAADLDIIDPNSFRVVKSQKRVPGTVITKLWEPLDDITINSIYKMLHICLGKTMERYKLQEKIKESRRILTNTWVEPRNPLAFLARLKLTNLPLKTTMTSKINEINDVINYDLILKRNKYLQTLLSAELSQLNDLQVHYSNCQANYQSDYDYLQKFRDIVRKQEKEQLTNGDFSHEIISPDAPDNINLAPSNPSSFIPDHDPEIKSILTKLDTNLTNLDRDTNKLQITYDKLKTINNMIEMLL